MKPITRMTVVALGIGLACWPSGFGRKQAPHDASAEAVGAMNRGVSLMGQYLYDDAVKAFEAVLRAAPDLTEAKINLAIARFNRSHKEQRDLEMAGELLDAVLLKEPANVRALYCKGILLQHLGQTGSAVACFEKVVQQRPEDGAAWYLLATCKQRLGQNAEQALLKAVALRPYLASAYYRLWQSLEAEGQADKARSYLEKFKQLREHPLSETIELPQYNQMGDLALVRPLPAQNLPPITKSTFLPQPVRVLFSTDEMRLGYALSSPGGLEPGFGGVAAGDLNRDGHVDLVLTGQGKDGQGCLVLLHGDGEGRFADVTDGSGLEHVSAPLACALGDYDNDEVPDLFVACVATNHLLRGKGDGTFADVTQQCGLSTSPAISRCALFLDADHDGDLDVFVGGAAPAGNQLWNNNADGSFTNIASAAGLLCGEATTVAVLPGDLDGDRDMDLVLLREGQPAKVFLNELLGKYREADAGVSLRGDLGGVLQDFNGDHALDLLALGGTPVELRLYLGDGRGHFHPDDAFVQVAKAASWGAIRAVRAIDLDLDGDLDIAVFGTQGHILLNDGTGRFVFQRSVWRSASGTESAGAELFDLNGDLVADLLRLERGPKNQLILLPGSLSPPSTALALVPTGMRGRDKRTRSPASGYGVTLTVRAGLREQFAVFTGVAGGTHQSQLPVLLGLGGAAKADYVQMLWPDGVAQVEIALPAGQSHKIAELQRKISSCPVLFAWNGTRFEFVTDFAGVGGLGYFVAPGEYAKPQPVDHVKIEPRQLQARDGAYEVRITEPMEETAYVDRLELLAIDHPAGWQVFPDEHLAVTGPTPTHELLVVEKPILPKCALGPSGEDCTERLTRVDRRYAYAPTLDRRFFGFCQPHTLELDFGAQLEGVRTDQRVFLFINGYLEYPYSQTTYAASQAKMSWQPIRIERRTPDGQWQTLVRDAGALGGMFRTMTVNLTGLASGPDCRLRLITNLEIYYDQMFLGCDLGRGRVTTHCLPVAEAGLRRVGFAREYSPDGQAPLIYDYELSDTTAPFDVLKGAYTRYGPVKELLTEFDDQYVLVAPGDEIAVKFDATKLGSVPAGRMRSFILVSHAWCKDMDLYTATPQTLEPLPFRAMSRYPYPPTEQYPNTEEHQGFLRTYNTRIIE